MTDPKMVASSRQGPAWARRAWLHIARDFDSASQAAAVEYLNGHGRRDEEAAALAEGLALLGPEELHTLKRAGAELKRLLDPRASRLHGEAEACLRALGEHRQLGLRTAHRLLLAYLTSVRSPEDAARIVPTASPSGVARLPVDPAELTRLRGILNEGRSVVLLAPLDHSDLPVEPDPLYEAVSALEVGERVARLILDGFPWVAEFAPEAWVLFPDAADDPNAPIASWTQEALESLLTLHALEREREDAGRTVLTMAAATDPGASGPAVLATLVFPPSHGLRRLPPSFQAAADPAAALAAVEALLACPEVKLFAFLAPKGAQRVSLTARRGPLWRAVEVTLAALAPTLPEGEGRPVAPISTYLLADAGIAPGSPLAPRSFAILREALNRRLGWPEDTVQGPRAVARGELGLMGYAESVALLLRCTWNPQSERLRQRLLASAVELPLSSDTLDELRALLGSARAAGLRLLERFSQLNPQLGRAILPFVSEALETVAQAFEPETWALFLAKLRLTLASEPAAFESIGLLLDVLSDCPEKASPSVRFGLLDARLAVAQLRGDHESAQRIREVWHVQSAVEAPPSEVEAAFELRCAQLEAHRFGFETALNQLEARLALNPPHKPLLEAARVQALAFLEHPSLALSLGELLFAEHGLPEPPQYHLQRAHLLYDRGRLEGAPALFDQAISHVLAALRLGSLEAREPVLEATESAPQVVALLAKLLVTQERRPDWVRDLFSPARLAPSHPYEAVAFWGAVLLHSSTETKDRARARALALFLTALGEGQRQDVLGVIQACYQRHLYALGLLAKSEVTVNIHQVRAASQPSTLAWLEQTWIKRPQTLGERLNPLTFSYR